MPEARPSASDTMRSGPSTFCWRCCSPAAPASRCSRVWASSHPGCASGSRRAAGAGVPGAVKGWPTRRTPNGCSMWRPRRRARPAPSWGLTTCSSPPCTSRAARWRGSWARLVSGPTGSGAPSARRRTRPRIEPRKRGAGPRRASRPRAESARPPRRRDSPRISSSGAGSPGARCSCW